MVSYRTLVFAFAGRWLALLLALLLGLAGGLATAQTPGQTPAQTRLREALRRACTDTARCRLYLALAEEAEAPDSSVYYYRRSLAGATRALPAAPAALRGPLRGAQAEALAQLGRAHYFFNRVDSATACLERAATLWHGLHDGPREIPVLSSLASIYFSSNDHRRVLATNQRGLRLLDHLPPTAAAGRAASDFLCDAALYYSSQHDDATAERYCRRGLRLLEQSADTLGMASVLMALATAELNQGRLPTAEAHAARAARLADRRGEVFEQLPAYGVLGKVQLARGELLAARQSFGRVLALDRSGLGAVAAVGKALLNMADVEQRLNHPARALAYAARAEAAMGPQKVLFMTTNVARVRAASYAALGQPGPALANYKNYIAGRDSLSTEATRRAALVQRLTDENQHHEAALRASQRRRQAAAEAEINRQKTLRWTGLGGAAGLLLLLLGFGRWQRARQRAVQALEARRLADLQALDRLKTTFFTNVSHEFRTPLTLILGPAETLAADPSPAVRAQGSLVRRNARKLLRLVTQLLDLSKLEAGALRLRPTAGDAAQATRQAVGQFASLADGNGVALLAEVPPGPLPLVFDAAKLEEMLDNLLANALRLTPAGGRVRVAVAATPATATAPAGVRFAVADTGPGIAPEHLARLFERFYQVPGGGEAHAGTGLGLALVRELAALHGGTAAVESTAGQGTTFSVWLPQGLAAAAEPAAASAAVAPSGSEPHQPANPPTRQSTTPPLHQPADDAPLVLLVEDNADVRAFVRATLAPAGYRLLEAPGGDSGLALARAEVPDLIVSDVMMPGLSGYELCAALKSAEATSHIPVVLLTARASADDKLEGLETGADAYLAKPFNPRELQAQVRNLLALRQRVQQRFGRAPAVLLAAAETAPPAAPPANPLADPAALAALPPLDQQFLRRVAALLDQHLADEGFGVDQLSEALALSRTQVNRKLKALTGQSPGDLLRRTRLALARHLLQTQPLTVGEVAFRVGYGSPSHFSTAFVRQFGLVPSAVQRPAAP